MEKIKIIEQYVVKELETEKFEQTIEAIPALLTETPTAQHFGDPGGDLNEQYSLITFTLSRPGRIFANGGIAKINQVVYGSASTPLETIIYNQIFQAGEHTIRLDGITAGTLQSASQVRLSEVENGTDTEGTKAFMVMYDGGQFTDVSALAETPESTIEGTRIFNNNPFIALKAWDETGAMLDYLENIAEPHDKEMLKELINIWGRSVKQVEIPDRFLQQGSVINENTQLPGNIIRAIGLVKIF